MDQFVGGSLPKHIYNALSNSEYQIVICAPGVSWSLPLFVAFPVTTSRIIKYVFPSEMFGKCISGLNETIELLEYNTVAVELMYHGRWSGSLSAKGTYFEYPLLGKQIGYTPDYEIYITEPKHSKEHLHIGQYWGEVIENTIFNRKYKYALCSFRECEISMDEIRLLSMIDDESDGLVYESLREEHLPALCFIEKKTYMFLITQDLQ